MNYNIQNFGDGAHNIFRLNNLTPSNVPIFGSPGSSALNVFGDTSQKMPESNNSSFGLFNQQTANLNAASKGFLFGSQSTFSKGELGQPLFGLEAPASHSFGLEAPASHSFGLEAPASNMFGQKDCMADGNSFLSTDSKETFKLFGQTSSNSFMSPHTSPNVFNTPQNQPNVFSGNNSKNVFGRFGNNTTNVESGQSQTDNTVFGGVNNVFGRLGNQQTSYTKNNPQIDVFGAANLKRLQPSRTEEGGEVVANNERIANRSQNNIIRNILREGLTRLEVQNIPEHVYNKELLLQHFSKFGKVMRIILKINSSAVVTFDTNESAKNAKENGRFIDPESKPLLIVFKTGNIQRLPNQVRLGVPRVQAPEYPKSSDLESMHDTNRTAHQVAPTAINNNNNRVSLRDVNVPAGMVDEHAAGGDDGNLPIDMMKQARPEKVELTGPDFPKHESSSLRGLASIKATNSEDKYHILEQRDKIVRNAVQKSTDLAETNRGTCTDMCPEKERYVREYRRRLAVFEMVPGTDQPGQTPLVDHFRAVKEYSRSAADQEMPLPCELRPPHILKMTMDYLLAFVMDKGSVGFRDEWYNFLWNRMRAIKKDITQQMLTDMTTIELLEKSARFHIVCSELMCEEESDVFDPKINSDNLSKYLWILNPLYKDLYVKHGVVCPNEAEFRSYMILMNINTSGDILRKVQDWRPEVRQSHAVKNSMQIYTSVNNNNYVRFFKLAKKASYLDSCILHRYFNQVRSMAVTQIDKAFRLTSLNLITYPFQDLVDHLGFDSSEEGVIFLSNFGLTVTNGQIISENKYGKAVANLPLKRSCRLVGSKIKTSLGEIVNGGPLPSPANYVPQNSFSQQGFLQLDEVDSRIATHHLTSGPDLIRHRRISAERTRLTPAPDGHEADAARTEVRSPRRQRFTRLEVDEVMSDIVYDIIQEVMKEETEEVIEDSHRFVLLASLSGEAMLRETVEDCIRECSVEVMNQSRRETEELVDRLANQTALQIYEEVIHSEMQKVCLDTLNHAWSIEAEMRKDDAVFSLADDLLREVAVDESQAYCLKYYESKVEGVLEGLRDLKANEDRRLLRKSWNNWTTALKQKQIDRMFPSTVNLHQSTTEVFRSMFPRSDSGDFRIATSSDFLPLDGHFGVSLLGTDEVLSRQDETKLSLEKEEANMMERRRYCWSPLDVFKMVEDRVVTRNFGLCGESKLFWKLIISLPSNENIFTYKQHHFTKWLARKFTMTPNNKTPGDGEDICFLHSKSLVIQPRDDATSNRYASLNVCVRSIMRDSTSPTDLMGASAIAFFIQDHSHTFSDHQLFEMEAHRLLVLLSSKPSAPAGSLVVMVSLKGRHLTTATIAEKLRLRNLTEDGLISSFAICAHDELCVNDVETSHLLDDSIQWLVQNSPQNPSLHTQPIIEFFEDCVQRFFIKPVLNNLKKRKEKSLHDLPFSILIDSYNEIIGWLMQMITSDDLCSVSWPPGEFCNKYQDLPSPNWNTRMELNQLERLVRQLILLPSFPVVQDATFRGTCRTLSEYVGTVVHESTSSLKLVTKINNLLEKTEVEAASRKRSKRKSMETSFLPSSSILPRTSIILACIDFKLSELFGAKDPRNDRPLMITYFKDSLLEENAPSLNSLSLKDYSELKPKVISKVNSPSNQCNVSYRSDVCNLSAMDSSFNFDLSSLFDQINSEKEATQKFGRFLERALEDDKHDDSRLDVGSKYKKAKFMTNEELRLPSSSPPAQVDYTYSSSMSLEDEINYLSFKIEQERQASALLELKAKLLLSEFLG